MTLMEEEEAEGGEREEADEARPPKTLRRVS